MASDNLLHQIYTMRRSLLRKKIINTTFTSFEEHADENEKPGFLEEVTILYFNESTNVIASLEKALETSPVDINNLDMILNNLKSSAVSIGANKVSLQIDRLRENFNNRNLARFKDNVIRLKIEHNCLKEKLEHYYQLRREAQYAEMEAQLHNNNN